MEKITKKTVEKMSQQFLDVMKKRKTQKLQKMNERNETNNNDFSSLYNDAHLSFTILFLVSQFLFYTFGDLSSHKI